jgi:uncharacterized protein YbjT (DUF2867 family)
MRLLIAGASGMVGSESVRLATGDPEITSVTALLRRPIDAGPRVKNLIHQDFLHYDVLKEVFAQCDACIWCLGISQIRVNAGKYFTITHDYAVAAAKAIREANPAATFTFLSAMGADASGKSMIRFGRVKGQTENTLKTLGLRQLYIFRPGAVIANPRFTQTGTHKKIEQLMMRSFSIVLPGLSVRVTDLARLMLAITKRKGEMTTWSQKDIIAAVRATNMG